MTPACLSDLEVKRFLAAARARHARDAKRDHLLLAFLLATGVRPSEALALKVEDFHLRDRDPWVRVRRLKKRTSRGVLDDLPLSRAMGRALRQWLTNHPNRERADFSPSARPWDFSLRYLERVFHDVARAADLPRGLKLYALRHTAGSRLYRATRDQRLVQQQLGHARLSTTEIYVHIDPERRRAAAELVGSDL